MRSNHFLPMLLLSTGLAFAGDPSLTIYNQNFAVVRDLVPLDLKSGVNTAVFHDITMRLEPDSVILRDPEGKRPIQIIEQNYRNDPVSQGLLLSLFEGKAIDFYVREANKPDRTVSGKIIRSGYVPPAPPVNPYYQPPVSPGESSQPIVEVDGKIQFSLPGQPIFPSLGDDTILKPQLSWSLGSKDDTKFDAELCYITAGMSWEADYNIVSRDTSDVLDVVGWITMDNQSGKTFNDARIKLMAGDVNKIAPETYAAGGVPMPRMSKMAYDMAGPPVTEKSFDEYHLYTLSNRVTLRDRETKQVEFVRATGVKSERIYVYDGLQIDWNRFGGIQNLRNFRNSDELGADSNTKVAVMREFKNSKENNLGMPLPAGRLRFYRQDDDGQLEFIGENQIEHTPKDETIRVFTGNAFDLVGERKRTSFEVDGSNHWANEGFEITLRNHKKEAVEIRVVEHLYRWINWEITEKSQDFKKTNAQEIEFRVKLAPDEEKTITYKVHYSW